MNVLMNMCRVLLPTTNVQLYILAVEFVMMRTPPWRHDAHTSLADFVRAANPAPPH